MNFIKKIIGFALSLSILTSCSSTVVNPDELEFAYSTDTLGVRTGSYAQRTEENPFRIGIIQYGTHASLDNCFIGVKRGLDNSDLNISFEYQNGNFDIETTKNIANKMVLDGYDVIIPIATNATIATFDACTYSQTPIVFTAVSDPVGAGLVNNLIIPDSYITGTSTIFDPSAQLDLIQSLQPDITSVGVIYSLNEPNSNSELNALREEATRRGIEIVSAGVASAENITEATYSIITRVQAITNLSDNNIVSNLTEIIEIADIADIPVYGTEVEQLNQGCVAAQTIDYVAVGQKTAEIAINIMLGKDISTIPVTVFDEVEFCYNDEVMESFGFEMTELAS